MNLITNLPNILEFKKMPVEKIKEHKKFLEYEMLYRGFLYDFDFQEKCDKLISELDNLINNK